MSKEASREEIVVGGGREKERRKSERKAKNSASLSSSFPSSSSLTSNTPLPSPAPLPSAPPESTALPSQATEGMEKSMISSNLSFSSISSTSSTSSSTHITQAGQIENVVMEGEWRWWKIRAQRMCNHPTHCAIDDDWPLGSADLPPFAVALPEKFTLLQQLAYEENEYWGADLKVLRFYLENTFRRASELSHSRLTISAFFTPQDEKMPQVVTFNTGLLSKNGEPLYAVFHRNTKNTQPKWFLFSYQAEPTLVNPTKMAKHHRTLHMPKELIPRRVTYWERSIAELSFDPTVEVVRMDAQYLEDKLRIHTRVPFPFDELPIDELIARIRMGIEKTLIRLESQPRLAVPQFFRDRRSNGSGELQLLIPIRLDFSQSFNTAHCAIALRPIYDKQRLTYYLPLTVLSVETAYMHARLVQPVDQLWLWSHVDDYKFLSFRGENEYQSGFGYWHPSVPSYTHARGGGRQYRSYYPADPRYPANNAKKPQTQRPRIDDADAPPIHFDEQDFEVLREIMTSPAIDKEVVELAQLAPYLKARIPKLRLAKGSCKRLVEEASKVGIVTVQFQGKQTYIQLPLSLKSSVDPSTSSTSLATANTESNLLSANSDLLPFG